MSPKLNYLPKRSANHKHQNRLIADTKNSDLERQDVAQLLEVISQTALSGDYVLGWEFGT